MTIDVIGEPDRLMFYKHRGDPTIAIELERGHDTIQVTTEEAARLKAALIAGESVAWPD